MARIVRIVVPKYPHHIIHRSNRSAIIDAEGNTTVYTYDERDMLFKVTDAQGNITEYTYDTNATLKTIKDARQRHLWQG